MTELKTTPKAPGEPERLRSIHLLPIIPCEIGKSIKSTRVESTKNKKSNENRERLP